MKKLIMLLVLGSLISMGCGVPQRKLVLLGDSHTAGACIETPCNGFNVILGNNLPPTYVVKTIGLLGWPMHEVAYNTEMFENNIKPYVNNAIINVMLGSNDRFWDYTPDDVELAAMILNLKLHAAGATQVIFLPPPPIFNNEEANEVIASYRERILNMCQTTEGAMCGPDTWKILHEEHFIDPEGVIQTHMNQLGHRTLGTRLTWFYFFYSIMD